MSQDNVVDQLLASYKQKLVELKKIYDALKIIQETTGRELEIPKLSFEGGDELLPQVSHQGGQFIIKPDQFVGKSQPGAAEEYLKMVGNAVSLDEIYKALERGGVEFKNEEKGKTSLYTQLIRATRKFKKIGSGKNVVFGLLEFYPNLKKKKIKEKDSAGDVGVASPEGEVENNFKFEGGDADES